MVAVWAELVDVAPDDELVEAALEVPDDAAVPDELEELEDPHAPTAMAHARAVRVTERKFRIGRRNGSGSDGRRASIAR